MRASVPRSRLASRRQSCCAHARPQKAGAPGMAAKSFASRLGGSGRSLGVFVAGAAVGAAGGGFAAVQWLERQSAEAAPAVREPDGKSEGLRLLLLLLLRPGLGLESYPRRQSPPRPAAAGPGPSGLPAGPPRPAWGLASLLRVPLRRRFLVFCPRGCPLCVSKPVTSVGSLVHKGSERLSSAVYTVRYLARTDSTRGSMATLTPGVSRLIGLILSPPK